MQPFISCRSPCRDRFAAASRNSRKIDVRVISLHPVIADPCMADPLSRCQPPSKFLATPLSSYPQNSVFLPSQGPSDHHKGSFNTSKSPLTILERAPKMCVDKFNFYLIFILNMKLGPS